MVENEKRTGIFGEDLRAVRTLMGMTQEQMARRFRVAFSTYARWELGISLPDKKHRLALARLLGIKKLEFQDE